MKKRYCFLLPITFLFFQAKAQLPEDAIRIGYTVPSGTAREQAIGGAMGSLGGEISSAFVNPAGLGLYRNREIVISPGLRALTDKSNYLGTATSGSSASRFNLGTSGIVFGSGGQELTGGAFAITVNQTANFTRNLSYSGQNSYSSFAEQYAEEFADSHLSINDGLAGNGLSYGTRMALYNYLIDTATVNGNLQVIAQPSKGSSFLLNQQNNLKETGGITEIGLSFGLSGNNRRWALGGTIGIPILNYSRTLTYSETDASGNPNNDFNSFTYQENYTSKGIGINAKLGTIFSPNSSLRFGLAVHTPTGFRLTDHVSSSLSTNLEGYTSNQQQFITSDELDNLSGYSANSQKYVLRSPWKFIASGSWLFGATENVKQQKGFITADLEYTTVNTVHFRPRDSTDEDGNSISPADNPYFDALNSIVKGIYKGVWGLRIGGELKFDTWMVRAGLAHYTSPYSDHSLSVGRTYASAGLGYRNKGIFVDLAYVAAFNNDVNFPYRLEDKANTYATVHQYGGTVIMTLGFKF